VWARGRYPQVVKARSLLCYWAARELGFSLTELAKRFDLSVPAIVQSVKRGEQIAREGQLRLM
jgi:predicted DNA-binding protein YlxM (UPF0122 family)